jgi:hypothetical protein
MCLIKIIKILFRFLTNKCLECGNIYTPNKRYRWCKPCQINHLKNNFKKWTSENKKIDDFIKKMQLKINDYRDIIFEWIPYDKFDNIKEIGINSSTNNNKNGSSITKTYFATFKDGPLYYRNIFWGYLRYIDAVVALKWFNINLQDEDAIDEFLNEVLYCTTVQRNY